MSQALSSPSRTARTATPHSLVACARRRPRRPLPSPSRSSARRSRRSMTLTFSRRRWTRWCMAAWCRVRTRPQVAGRRDARLSTSPCASPATQPRSWPTRRPRQMAASSCCSRQTVRPSSPTSRTRWCSWVYAGPGGRCGRSSSTRRQRPSRWTSPTSCMAKQWQHASWPTHGGKTRPCSRPSNCKERTCVASSHGPASGCRARSRRSASTSHRLRSARSPHSCVGLQSGQTTSR